VRSGAGERTGPTGSPLPTETKPGSLGYEVSEWERIPVSDDDQVIFLPGNDEDLADDAFVVLEEDDLCDLVTRR